MMVEKEMEKQGDEKCKAACPWLRCMPQ